MRISIKGIPKSTLLANLYNAQLPTEGRQVKRRTRLASIFPNVESCLRLVSAQLVEIDEDWQTGRSYIASDAKQ